MASRFTVLWADRLRHSENCFRRSRCSSLNCSHTVSFLWLRTSFTCPLRQFPERDGSGQPAVTLLLRSSENIQAARCSSSLHLMTCWPGYRERLSNSHTRAAWFVGCCSSSVIAMRNVHQSSQLSNIMFWDTATKRLQPGVPFWEQANLANKDPSAKPCGALAQPRVQTTPAMERTSIPLLGAARRGWKQNLPILIAVIINTKLSSHGIKSFLLMLLVWLIFLTEAPLILLHFPIKCNLSLQTLLY